MKKIIKNKLYDTETAKLVGDWDNGYYANDFNFCSETLYQKKTGEFFLYGYGNALSKYAVSHGNNTSGSEKIISMTYEEAQDWAERKLDADKYIKLFGELGESDGDGKQRICLYLASTVVEKAKKEAAKKAISVSEYISKLIEPQ